MRYALAALLGAVLLFAAPAQAQKKEKVKVEKVEKLPPVESGVAEEGVLTEDAGPMTEMDGSEVQRVMMLGYVTQYITAYCQQKNVFGTILWRYNSRWQWTYGDYGIIRAADHWEWGDHTNLGWRYGGSSYLEGYGGINTSYVGRTVRGRFEFAPGGTFVKATSVRLRVIVYGNGQVNTACNPQ